MFGIIRRIIGEKKPQFLNLETSIGLCHYVTMNFFNLFSVFFCHTLMSDFELFQCKQNVAREREAYFFNSILIRSHLDFVSPSRLQEENVVRQSLCCLFCVISTFIFDTSLFIWRARSVAMKNAHNKAPSNYKQRV